jgi:uncharacterized protein
MNPASVTPGAKGIPSAYGITPELMCALRAGLVGCVRAFRRRSRPHKETPRWKLGLVSVAFLATACVTINIYFPEAAAEQVADRIIDGVWGPETPIPAAPPQSRRSEHLLQRMGVNVLNLFVAPAHAQAEDIDISSPAIQRMEASMRTRHERLAPYYDSGAVGLTRNGLLEVRDQNLIPLAERNQVRQLVADENVDRTNLYREIAITNNNPQWETQIRATFARRWIDRARPGWFYRDESGNWQAK